jgi:hypothetical protein
MRGPLWAACAAVTSMLVTAPALAQDSNLGFFAGVRVWNVDWTTWGYGTNSSNREATTQEPTHTKTLVIPVVGVRWRDFLATLGGFSSTDFTFVDGGGTITRKELDLNLGWYVTPGTALTLGYKRTGQRAQQNYELAGPTVGMSATAPLGGGVSLYGLLGLGRLKPTGASTVDLDADYQLTEVGAAYNVPVGRIVRSITFTAGYRIQVIDSKDVLNTRAQNARDLTQGFNIGVSGSF